MYKRTIGTRPNVVLPVRHVSQYFCPRRVIQSEPPQSQVEPPTRRRRHPADLTSAGRTPDSLVRTSGRRRRPACGRSLCGRRPAADVQILHKLSRASLMALCWSDSPSSQTSAAKTEIKEEKKQKPLSGAELCRLCFDHLPNPVVTPSMFQTIRAFVLVMSPKPSDSLSCRS